MEVLDRRLRGHRTFPRPGRTSLAAAGVWLLALPSEQMLELIAERAGFQSGLVLTPGLTGLQDSPEP
jgi:hypothetical protein